MEWGEPLPTSFHEQGNRTSGKTRKIKTITLCYKTDHSPSLPYFSKKLCALCVLCGSMVLKEVRDQSMNHRGQRGHRESMVSVIVVAIGSYLPEYD